MLYRGYLQYCSFYSERLGISDLRSFSFESVACSGLGDKGFGFPPFGDCAAVLGVTSPYFFDDEQGFCDVSRAVQGPIGESDDAQKYRRLKLDRRWREQPVTQDFVVSI